MFFRCACCYHVCRQTPLPNARLPRLPSHSPEVIELFKKKKKERRDQSPRFVSCKAVNWVVWHVLKQQHTNENRTLFLSPKNICTFFSLRCFTAFFYDFKFRLKLYPTPTSTPPQLYSLFHFFLYGLRFRL